MESEHECSWCPERAMTALTPKSHKRIRLMEEREGDGEISDEYEDYDVYLREGGHVKKVAEEPLSRKRKLADDVQSKLVKVEEGLHNEEQLLIGEDIGFGEKEISENKEEKMPIKVADEQDTVEEEDLKMLEKMVDSKEEVKDEKSQKLVEEEQITFDEEEILEEEEDEMLAYLWPGSVRRSVV